MKLVDGFVVRPVFVVMPRWPAFATFLRRCLGRAWRWWQGRGNTIITSCDFILYQLPPSTTAISIMHMSTI